LPVQSVKFVLLSADKVYFSYGQDRVLNGICLTAQCSEILGIVGPNGSGKTTFLKCINKILTPSQGNILLEGDLISSMPRIEVAKRIGYVPQNSNGNGGQITVFEVVLMGRRPHINWSIGQSDENKVWAVLRSMNMEHLASRRFDELSSGQRQKVLISRALAQEAKVILLDEPTSNLDIRHQLEVMEMLRSLVREKSLVAIAVVHDLDLALKYCDKVVMMKDGVVFASGNKNDVLTPENIETVYGVKVAIDNSYGRPHIVVL